MLRIDKCPKCSSIDIIQTSVDIGVGEIYGPAYCTSCGWDQQEEVEDQLRAIGFKED